MKCPTYGHQLEESKEFYSEGYKAGYALKRYNNPYPEDSGDHYKFMIDYRDGYLWRKTVDNYPFPEPPSDWDENLVLEN